MPDRGLQVERTRLAWRRTALALAVGSLLAIRVLGGLLGIGAVAVGAAGVVLAAIVWWLAERRGTRTASAFVEPGLLHPGAVPLLLVATLTAGGAGLALLWVLLR